jgi:hypothetical protein
MLLMVNDQIVVNHPTVVNCPYKWAKCSKLSKCCDKMYKKKQKNTTLSEQFENQLLVFWYFPGFQASPQNAHC